MRRTGTMGTSRLAMRATSPAQAPRRIHDDGGFEGRAGGVDAPRFGLVPRCRHGVFEVQGGSTVARHLQVPARKHVGIHHPVDGTVRRCVNAGGVERDDGLRLFGREFLHGCACTSLHADALRVRLPKRLRDEEQVALGSVPRGEAVAILELAVLLDAGEGEADVEVAGELDTHPCGTAARRSGGGRIRSLDDAYAEAALGQAEGGGRTDDAGTDDQSVAGFVHARR